MSQLTVDARDPVHRWTWRKFHHLHDFNHFRSAGSLPLTAIHQRFPSKYWHFPATFGRISSNVNTFCDNEAFGTLLTWIFKHQEQKATETLRLLPPIFAKKNHSGWPNFFHRRQMGVSENGGTPKSSNLIGISIINHPFWGTPIFGNTQMVRSYSGNVWLHTEKSSGSRWTALRRGFPIFVINLHLHFLKKTLDYICIYTYIYISIHVYM